MRCFVTGATGFVGSHLATKLHQAGCEVAVLARSEKNLWRLGELVSSLRVVWGDLGNVPAFAGALRDFQPQVVIHAGWAGVAKAERNQHAQIHTNLHGSLDLLQVCLSNGCHTWIGLGSQAEYGPANEVLVEDLVPKPDGLYGLAKLCVGLQSQRMCAQAGVRSAWLRLTAAYGPKDEPEHLIPHVIQTLIKKEEPALTAGEQQWDYLFIDDVAEAVWCAIQQPSVSGIYNLSSGKGVAVRKICELIRDQIDPRLPLGFGKIPAASGARRILAASNQLFCHAAGWKPATELDQGLRCTIEWYSRADLQDPTL